MLTFKSTHHVLLIPLDVPSLGEVGGRLAGMVFFQLCPLNGLNNSAKSLILCLALYMLMQIVAAWNGSTNYSGYSATTKPAVTSNTPANSPVLSYTSRYLRINEYLFTGVDAKTYVASSTDNNNNARKTA